MNWIFNSFKQDFLKIYTSGIVSYIVYLLIAPTGANSLWFVFFNFIVFNLTDVGHTYTTMYKTILDPKERKHSHMYWLTPLIIISMILIWRFNFNFLWFWVFVAYYTLFHNQRQAFGIMKWYESLNKKVYKETKLFFYSLTLLPVLIHHFRELDFSIFYYVSQEPLFRMPPDKVYLDVGTLTLQFHTPIHAALVGVWFLLVNVWILWEVNNYLKTKQLEFNRLLAMVYFGGIYSYSFLICRDSAAILVLLISSHGLPYMFMMDKRMKLIPDFNTFKKYIPWVIGGLAAIGGVLDYFYNVIIYHVYTNFELLIRPTGWQLILIIFYITPILSHFIWDSYLWKKEHPDSKYVYRK
jgi:hypothetical protein